MGEKRDKKRENTHARDWQHARAPQSKRVRERVRGASEGESERSE